MEKPKILFHGSRFLIKDYIVPKKADDKNSKINSQNAIYATDRFECAKGMSLTGEQWAFANFNNNDFKIIFVEEAPKEKERYVYEISSKNFVEQPEGSHQWISFEKAKILKTYKFKTSNLKDFWRMATKQEKEEKYSLHNKAYK